MRVAHLLRKYNPLEWGGTETAVRQLSSGLKVHGVDSDVYCPWIQPVDAPDPLVEVGCRVKRFKAWVPVWGISPEQRRQMVSVGGNLMSFDLMRTLWREREAELIHSHALGRIGGIGLTIARRRGIPFVVTIHGGVYELPQALKDNFHQPYVTGWEWGKLFGVMLRSRRVLDDADVVVTCNPREAEQIRQHHPKTRVHVQPHGVSIAAYATDCRPAALDAFPIIRDRQVLLVAGRIDPQKNQEWIIKELPELVRQHPTVMLVCAGPGTNESYTAAIKRQIEQLGLSDRVLLTGGMPPNDPRLIGLFQEARAVVLPSLCETFGLVILEAWAAGTPVVASRTVGANSLIEHGKTGSLFDLDRPASFHRAVNQILWRSDVRSLFVNEAQKRVAAEFDVSVLAARMKAMYEVLVDEKRRCTSSFFATTIPTR